MGTLNWVLQKSGWQKGTKPKLIWEGSKPFPEVKEGDIFEVDIVHYTLIVRCTEILEDDYGFEIHSTDFIFRVNKL